METLANAARVDRYYLGFQGVLRKSLRAIELARQHDDLFVEVAARNEASFAYGDAGELEQARQHAVAMLEGAERLRDRYWLSSALNFNRALCYSMGDWLEGREFSNRGLAVSPMEPRILGLRGLLEYDVGDFSQGEVFLQRLLEVVRILPPAATTAFGLTSLVIPLVNRATGADVSLEVAEEAAQTILSLATATPLVATQARSGLALLALSKGDLAQATELYNVLQTYCGILPPGGMVIDRLLGL